jgi:hypothetical protein
MGWCRCGVRGVSSDFGGDGGLWSLLEAVWGGVEPLERATSEFSPRLFRIPCPLVPPNIPVEWNPAPKSMHCAVLVLFFHLTHVGTFYHSCQDNTTSLGEVGLASWRRPI